MLVSGGDVLFTGLLPNQIQEKEYIGRESVNLNLWCHGWKQATCVDRDGNRVNVGNFDGNGLNVNNWNDSNRNDNLGLASSRQYLSYD